MTQVKFQAPLIFHFLHDSLRSDVFLFFCGLPFRVLLLYSMVLLVLVSHYLLRQLAMKLDDL